MMLPDWPMVRITRRKEMVQGRGINYSDNFQDGDLAGSENLSVRRWPYIATRNARKRVEEHQGVTAMTSWNGLVVVRPGDHDGTTEDKVLYQGESIGWLEHLEGVTRQFAAVNTRLVIWPDKKYLDMADKTIKDLGAEAEASGADFPAQDKEKKNEHTNTVKFTLAEGVDLTQVFRPGDGVEIAGLSELEDNNISVYNQKDGMPNL